MEPHEINRQTAWHATQDMLDEMLLATMPDIINERGFRDWKAIRDHRNRFYTNITAQDIHGGER
jgi:hypothetical protein